MYLCVRVVVDVLYVCMCVCLFQKKKSGKKIVVIITRFAREKKGQLTERKKVNGKSGPSQTMQELFTIVKRKKCHMKHLRSRYSNFSVLYDLYFLVRISSRLQEIRKRNKFILGILQNEHFNE